MDRRYFSDKIVEWYRENKRSLPWRNTRNPYKIWLSEIILQQTRVTQGLPYYRQFIRNYPDVTSLAKASEQAILRLWQGLGYYTRARNLHKCAKAVVKRHRGKFPRTYKDLLLLPGIGEYTAAAIASFSYHEPVPVVDGNVFRILSRIFGVDTPVNTPEGKKQFTRLAADLISHADPALHNQAVMEFGALFCTPKNPKCADCGLKTACFAFNHDLVNSLPFKTARRKSRNRYFFYLVVEKNGKVLMKKRDRRDIWQGLFDFPLIEKTRPAKMQDILAEIAAESWLSRGANITVSKAYRHILTHQVIYCRFINIRLANATPARVSNLAFYTPNQIGRLPKPALISRFLDEQKTR
jgi:A/G-specific adenine glycosylase